MLCVFNDGHVLQLSLGGPASSYPVNNMNYAHPMVGSNSVHRKKVTIGHESDSDEYDEEDMYLSKQNGGFKPVKGHSGMYYKVNKWLLSFIIIIHSRASLACTTR